MRRKPDMLWVLVIVFGLGVVTTGYTQSYLDKSSTLNAVPTLPEQR